MMATTVAEYLEDQSVGTVGTDIFVGNMNDDIDNQIVLYPLSGFAPSNTINLDIPGLQIIVRNTTWDTGYAKVYSVYRTLHKLTNTQVVHAITETIQRIEATGSPNDLGPDEKGRFMFSVSFIVWMATSTS